MCSCSRGFRSLPRQLVFGFVIALGLLAWSAPASAYRPFDDTDAAVAKEGEMEIELQPAGRLHDESGTSLIARPPSSTTALAKVGKPSSKARDRRRFRQRDRRA
jgi:hypothetical protein